MLEGVQAVDAKENTTTSDVTNDEVVTTTTEVVVDGEDPMKKVTSESEPEMNQDLEGTSIDETDADEMQMMATTTTTTVQRRRKQQKIIMTPIMMAIKMTTMPNLLLMKSRTTGPKTKRIRKLKKRKKQKIKESKN
jgi:hypothetical protein